MLFNFLTPDQFSSSSLSLLSTSRLQPTTTPLSTSDIRIHSGVSHCYSSLLQPARLPHERFSRSLARVLRRQTPPSCSRRRFFRCEAMLGVVMERSTVHLHLAAEDFCSGAAGSTRNFQNSTFHFRDSPCCSAPDFNAGTSAPGRQSSDTVT